MSEIAKNIEIIRERIHDAASRAGRSADDITLVAAAKQNPPEKIREAIRFGIGAVGENRVQELMEKYADNAYQGAALHFIGRLQTNKVKYLVGKVSLIHSVDSVKLLSEIDRQSGKAGLVSDILIQINIGGEESKGGIPAHELSGFLKNAAEFSGVRIRGLMTIPPVAADKSEQLALFKRMYQLFIDNKAKKYDNISMDYLSMGMTDDYYEAVLCGANMVRIGSGIFGERNY